MDPYSTYKNDNICRDICPDCKQSVDRKDNLFLGKPEICTACKAIFCMFCVHGHRRTCPAPTQEQLAKGKKLYDDREKAAFEISEIESENCCKCGYKRDREMIIWSLYSPETKCISCDTLICSACNIGMSGKKNNKCKRKM